MIPETAMDDLIEWCEQIGYMMQSKPDDNYHWRFLIARQHADGLFIGYNKKTDRIEMLSIITIGKNTSLYEKMEKKETLAKVIIEVNIHILPLMVDFSIQRDNEKGFRLFVGKTCHNWSKEEFSRSFVKVMNTITLMQTVIAKTVGESIKDNDDLPEQDDYQYYIG